MLLVCIVVVRLSLSPLSLRFAKKTTYGAEKLTFTPAIYVSLFHQYIQSNTIKPTSNRTLTSNDTTHGDEEREREEKNEEKKTVVQ